MLFYLAVVDMVSSVYGEMPVLHHLVLNLIECGKVKQARRILEVSTPPAHNTQRRGPPLFIPLK